MAQEVFHRHRTELEMMRYLKSLSDRDYAMDRGMIPLGSCTMKLNAATEMMGITWPAFGDLHPFQPLGDAAGTVQLMAELSDALLQLTGYDAISLQPNAGSQGELAGLLAIRRYHLARGEAGRTVCLIPTSAHGTNAASAALAGYQVVPVAVDQAGNVSLEDLRSKLAGHGTAVGALMLTYPSTHGVYEESVREVCAAAHDAGAQVYIDGANFNALVGWSKAGHFGGDVSHLNLHKTFAIPHGGGGPGVGPVACRAHLAPYLPGHPFGGLDSRRMVNGHAPAVSHAVDGTLTNEDAEDKRNLGPGNLSNDRLPGRSAALSSRVSAGESSASTAPTRVAEGVGEHPPSSPTRSSAYGRISCGDPSMKNSAHSSRSCSPSGAGRPVLDRGSRTGAVSAAPYGSALVLSISWAYIAMMGGPGLMAATEGAVLAANYLAHRLDSSFPVLYRGPGGYVAHECLLDLRGLTQRTGVTAEDVAKRLMDYGFHAPTMSFPVAGTLMVEPTESESLAELDRFCAAMELIAAESGRISDGEWPLEQSPLRNAPHTAAALLVADWQAPYPRELGAYPAALAAAGPGEGAGEGAAGGGVRGMARGAGDVAGAGTAGGAEDVRAPGDGTPAEGSGNGCHAGTWNPGRAGKYWPPVGRVDATYGDRNLVVKLP
jgi:glycine cleavage system protein P-like pyridoxal-binding family